MGLVNDMPSDTENSVVHGLVGRLAIMHNHHTYPDVTESARDAAMELIIMAGFEPADSDNWGKEVGNEVFDLLVLAMQRLPQLADRILGIDPNVQIITEDLD